MHGGLREESGSGQGTYLWVDEAGDKQSVAYCAAGNEVPGPQEAHQSDSWMHGQNVLPC